MTYRFPVGLLLQIALSVWRRQPRSLGADSQRALHRLDPPPRLVGEAHLPPQGAFILVANHYERPGLWAGWGAMVINAVVWSSGAQAREVHWLMASELVALRLGPVPVPPSWVRPAFAQAAATYGMGLVSPRESGLVGGAAGLRAAARMLGAGQPVGILPEGTASRELCEARPGVGLALAWLARREVPLIPAGICEEASRLQVRFGPPFHLPAPERRAATRAESDRALRAHVMHQIASLLPPNLHGYYRGGPETCG